MILTNLAARRQSPGPARIVSLDGVWKAIIDPYDSGLVDIMGQPNQRGFFRDFKPRSPSDRVEYDFDSSLDLDVPGDWNTQHRELLYYEGTLWYRRLVSIDHEHDGRSFLSFGAANHTSRVYLDGQFLTEHVGGFGPFAVEVTGRLEPGQHSLVVMVNNRRQPDRIPAMRSDWWNFGGLHRSVELVHLPATFIADAWLTMAPDGSLVGGITIDRPDNQAGFAGQPARVELPDAEIVANADSEGRIYVDPAQAKRLERWNPGAPVHHRVVFVGGQDQVEDRIGFRTIRTEDASILVNDQPVFLNGISIHGEGPTGGRRASGPDDAATLLDWAEDLGANFVRLAHYQHDEAMVREADLRGFLIWCELPVYWGIDFANPATQANAMDQADELVIRDRSRAGVVLWSAANETRPGPDRQAFITAILDRFRALDPTRLTTAALLTVPSRDVSNHIDDPLGQAVDVIGVNQYLGWYYGERDQISSTRWTSDFNKPIVFSELGAGAKAGRHGTEDEIWTEEFQAAVYREQLAMIANQAECAGLSPWILKDFRTPLRVLPGVQDGYNRKGLVSEEGDRKLAFAVVAEWYRRQS